MSAYFKMVLAANAMSKYSPHIIILYLYLLSIIYGLRNEKTCHPGFVNNKGTDQPAHPRSLISTPIIRFVESIICKLATGEISII